MGYIVKQNQKFIYKHLDARALKLPMQHAVLNMNIL